MAESLQEICETKTCPLCPKKVAFADIDSLKVHFGLCQKERVHRCDQCGLGFRTISLLRGHEQIHNRGPKSFSCAVCKKTFHSRHGLSHHESVHQKPKFMCTWCGRPFRSKHALAGHSLKHLGLKPYKCSECQKEFSCAAYRNQHQLSHRPIKLFTCADCGKSYKRKNKLMGHVVEHLEMGYRRRLKQRTSQRFCCADCGKSYRQQAKSDGTCERTLGDQISLRFMWKTVHVA